MGHLLKFVHCEITRPKVTKITVFCCKVLTSLKICMYTFYDFVTHACTCCNNLMLCPVYTEGNSSHDRVFELVVDKLASTYPGHILSADKQEWLFINCGSWMGSFLVLHASVTEYVMLFGTGIHTSGNSGKYTDCTGRRFGMGKIGKYKTIHQFFAYQLFLF